MKFIKPGKNESFQRRGEGGGRKEKRRSYQESSIEVTLWVYFRERKNKIRLNQNIECRKMAPASRNLPLKL